MNSSIFSIKKTFLFTLLIAFTALSASAQSNDAEKAASIKNLIQNRSFIFEAQNVIPTRGSMMRQLSHGYDMRISGDSLITYLPYFGRAYSATYDAQGGIKFTTNDFDYKVKEKNKGWEISITPKDERDVRRMFLNISNSGYATLQITSNFRDPISFRGQIRGTKKIE